MKILVVSPHPDDETLGCGGTLLKYKKNGYKIFWLNFTDIYEECGYTKATIKKRKIVIDKVKEKYGFDKMYNLGYKTTMLETYPKAEMITNVSNIIDKIQPEIIFIPYKYDVHSDHKIVYEIMMSSTKVFRKPYIKKILMMEILSETDFTDSENGFVPNFFVNITEYLNKKLEIMKLYKNELGKHPFPRSLDSIKSLAILRGSVSNCKYAEGFIVVKCIE